MNQKKNHKGLHCHHRPRKAFGLEPEMQIRIFQYQVYAQFQNQLPFDPSPWGLLTERSIFFLPPANITSFNFTNTVSLFAVLLTVFISLDRERDGWQREKDRLLNRKWILFKHPDASELYPFRLLRTRSLSRKTRIRLFRLFVLLELVECQPSNI